MAIERVIRAATGAVGLAGLEMSTQTTKGIAKARQGKLEINDLVASWGVVATRWLDVWLAFMKPPFGPVLPAVVITWTAKDVPGQSPAGTAYLEDPVPDGVTPTATPLMFLGDPKGGTAPLPVTAGVFGADRGGLTITIAVATGSPAPPTGLYQGLVLLKETPIATAIALLG